MKHTYRITNEDGLGDIKFDRHKYVVHSMDIAPISNEISSSVGVGQSGKTIINQRYDDRDITIEGYILATNAKDMRDRRFELEKTLSLRSSFNLIIDEKYFLNCVPLKTIKYFTEPHLNNEQLTMFVIQATTTNPFFFELGDNRADLAGWSKDFHLPKAFVQNEKFILGHKQTFSIVEVANRGEVEAPIQLRMRAVGGTIINPYIANLTTNEHMKLITKMQPSDEIIINTGWSKKRIFNETQKLNLLGSLSLSSTFIQLPVGLSKINYGCDEASTGSLEIEMLYTPQYIGV